MTSSTDVAVALVESLVAAGVREAVVCPGSRSSPLAYALWRAAREGHLRMHVRVDERSAGFLALGLAKVSRRPAVVVTTSGTAVANLHPAVLEAHHGMVPLIVLSADRPAELRGTGANQTTIQPGIFGLVCREQADLGPGISAMDVAGHARDAVAAAIARGAGGPVHLNIQFREPLVPTALEAFASPSTQPQPGAASDDGLNAAPTSPSWPASASRASATGQGSVVSLPARTLVIIGDLPTAGDHARVVRWAHSQRMPIIAEPFGWHPRPEVVRRGALVAGSPAFVDAHLPEALVVAGRPTLSRSVRAMLRKGVPLTVVVDAGQEFDLPGHELTRVPLGNIEALEVTSRIAPAPDASAATESTVRRGQAAWLAAWSAAGDAVDAALLQQPALPESRAAAVHCFTGSVPSDSVVFVGSSSIPRELELGSAFASRVEVVASRGLAGIDGCVSTAIGVALAEPSRPTLAVLGDLTFLHDSGGLLIGPDEPIPDLTIVVLNDDGGGIFGTLEPGASALAPAFERLFGTPTATDLSALCRAHGVSHELAVDLEALSRAVARRPDGLRVVECRVDRTVDRRERARVAAVVQQALVAMTVGVGQGADAGQAHPTAKPDATR